MNLSETAFVRPQADGYDLRRFTPAGDGALPAGRAATVLEGQLLAPVT